MERFWSKVKKTRKCWLWTACRVGKMQYGKMTIEGRTVLAHRLSWKLHNGAIPKGKCVLHSCDTPTCVNPKHLFLGTIADNNRDCRRKRRHPRGEDHGSSKLTNKERTAIKRSKAAIRSLARKFGVSPRTIRRTKQWQRQTETKC